MTRTLFDYLYWQGWIIGAKNVFNVCTEIYSSPGAMFS